MPIQTILILLFAFLSTTFTPTFHLESNLADADAAAALTFTAGEQAPAQEKNAAVQSRGKTKRPKQEAPAQTLTDKEWETFTSIIKAAIDEGVPATLLLPTSVLTTLTR